jgi:glycosyltransferase involved in cell wall biosynthesis
MRSDPPIHPLRIALTSYRSHPHSGGQGVYVRQLSRALVALGHQVEVFSGQPYPELDDGVALTKVPSLDLFGEPDPWRVPRAGEFRDLTDVIEFSTMCTAGFPEPRTFSRRVVPVLRERVHEFDVVHDNQSFGAALLGLRSVGLPLVGTIHHPISVDRDIELTNATGMRRLTLRRWYGFVRMQTRVARRVDHLLTPSQNSAADAVSAFGLNPEQLHVVPIGVDTDRFRPRGPRTPGSIVTICSADVPLKGLAVLLQAFAALPADRAVRLTAVCKPSRGGDTERLITALDLTDRVTVVSGLGDAELAELVAAHEVACVPSLYEGFSLPAVEAMASGTALVATDTGAIPEVVGRDGTCGLLVPPGDVAALSAALDRLLSDSELRARVSGAGRDRVIERFSWASTARRTVEVYRRSMSDFHSTGSRVPKVDVPC